MTFKSKGIAYLGFRSKSFTAYQIARSFLFGQEEIFLFELVRCGCWDFWESRRTAALRIKGVVYWRRENKRGVGLLGGCSFWEGANLFDVVFWGKLTSPQHMPTMRNPITQRHIGGEGGGVVGEESGSIFC